MSASSAIVAPSDAELVCALAAGDRAALGALYDRYAGLLLSVGLRRLADRAEAEEVLHDVFVEAWRSAAAFDPARGSVRAWLVTRMHSRVLDRLRSPGVARRASLEAVAEARAAVEEPGVTVDRGRVGAALAALPPEQLAVVELAYFAGLSSSEIAARVDVPVGTVKSRAAAALAKLRGELLRRG